MDQTLDEFFCLVLIIRIENASISMTMSIIGFRNACKIKKDKLLISPPPHQILLIYPPPPVLLICPFADFVPRAPFFSVVTTRIFADLTFQIFADQQAIFFFATFSVGNILVYPHFCRFDTHFFLPPLFFNPTFFWISLFHPHFFYPQFFLFQFFSPTFLPVLFFTPTTRIFVDLTFQIFADQQAFFFLQHFLQERFQSTPIFADLTPPLFFTPTFFWIFFFHPHFFYPQFFSPTFLPVLFLPPFFWSSFFHPHFFLPPLFPFKFFSPHFFLPLLFLLPFFLSPLLLDFPHFFLPPLFYFPTFLLQFFCELWRPSVAHTGYLRTSTKSTPICNIFCRKYFVVLNSTVLYFSIPTCGNFVR